jgi:hypothetical protein
VPALHLTRDAQSPGSQPTTCPARPGAPSTPPDSSGATRRTHRGPARSRPGLAHGRPHSGALAAAVGRADGPAVRRAHASRRRSTDGRGRGADRGRVERPVRTSPPEHEPEEGRNFPDQIFRKLGIKPMFVATLGDKLQRRWGGVGQWRATVSGCSLRGRSRLSSGLIQRPSPAGPRRDVSAASGRLAGTGGSASQKSRHCWAATPGRWLVTVQSCNPKDLPPAG